jgi:hypothetical protein
MGRIDLGLSGQGEQFPVEALIQQRRELLRR